MSIGELKRHCVKLMHTLKYNYFIDDERRREYLCATYGKDSVKDLGIDELRNALELVGYKHKKRANKDNVLCG